MATPHNLPKKRGALKSTQISFLKAPQIFAVFQTPHMVTSKQVTKGGGCNQTSKWPQRPTGNKAIKRKTNKNMAKT